ncbi:MAG: hypothetical protein B7Z58_03865 [Acidiphilium sp. 37-64-53]|uniref:hypothetical protein n=4 Tax=Acidocellaceae TaxID=3385905 RepID=UPI000BD1751F|nr:MULTISPECIES: hypothetical protein [Acidiphilium]OYW03318.1 MAG: hypothetical protein B7Z58_03865 [Acidiphilium sp. 37-64-53]
MHPPLDIRIIGDLSAPDWWSIGLTTSAGILGAIIGALVSYLVARQTARESRQAEQAARRSAEEEATYRVGLKLMEIMNAAAGYHLAAERSIADNNASEVWLTMQAFSGKAKDITFESNELVAFWKGRQFEYITRIEFLINSYNSMIYSVEEYGMQRNNLMNKLKPDTMQGLVGRVFLTEEQLRNLNPEISAVRDLAMKVRDAMKDVHEQAAAAVDDFKSIVRKYFGDSNFPVPVRMK